MKSYAFITPNVNSLLRRQSKQLIGCGELKITGKKLENMCFQEKQRTYDCVIFNGDDCYFLQRRRKQTEPGCLGESIISAYVLLTSETTYLTPRELRAIGNERPHYCVVRDYLRSSYYIDPNIP